MKYYAIGETKVKGKDDKGKDTTSFKTVVITEEVVRSRAWASRIVAQNEAEAFCKRERMNLQGVYRAKESSDRNGIMTKNIKGQKAKATKQQLKRRVK